MVASVHAVANFVLKLLLNDITVRGQLCHSGHRSVPWNTAAVLDGIALAPHPPFSLTSLSLPRIATLCGVHAQRPFRLAETLMKCGATDRGHAAQYELETAWHVSVRRTVINGAAQMPFVIKHHQQ